MQGLPKEGKAAEKRGSGPFSPFVVELEQGGVPFAPLAAARVAHKACMPQTLDPRHLAFDEVEGASPVRLSPSKGGPDLTLRPRLPHPFKSIEPAAGGP